MKADSIVPLAVLLWIVCTVSAWAADDAPYPFSDLTRFKLDVGEADHLYTVTPEKGQVIIIKHGVTHVVDPEEDMVTVLNQHGERVFDRAPVADIPDLSRGRVVDATLRTNDKLVVTGLVKVGTSLLAEYDLGSGALVRVVQTGPIQCWDLYGDDEGTIWCLGTDVLKARDRREDYDLVHRFDGEGNVVGRSLHRNTLPPTARPLRATPKAHSGGFRPGNGCLWALFPEVQAVRFELDGTVRDRLSLPAWPAPEGDDEWVPAVQYVVALDDNVIAARTVIDSNNPEASTQSLYQLSAERSAWIPLQGAPAELPRRFELVGADRNGLILFDKGDWALVWYPLTPENTQD